MSDQAGEDHSDRRSHVYPNGGPINSRHTRSSPSPSPVFIRCEVLLKVSQTALVARPAVWVNQISWTGNTDAAFLLPSSNRSCSSLKPHRWFDDKEIRKGAGGKE